MENRDDEFFQIKKTSTRFISVPIRRLMVLAIVLSDILSIGISIGLAALIRYSLLGKFKPEAYIWVSIFLVFFIFSSTLRGLYPATGLSAVDQLRQLTITTSLLTMVIISATYFNKNSLEYSRLMIGLTWLFCLFTIPLDRMITRHIMSRANIWGDPVVLIGTESQVDVFIKLFGEHPKIGLKPEFCLITASSFNTLTPRQRSQLVKNARRISEDKTIHTVIIAYTHVDDLKTIREIFSDIFDRLILANPENFGKELNGVILTQYGRLHTFEIHHTLMDQFAQFQKRVIDIVISFIGLVLLFPFLCVIALLVATNSHGNIFYRQKRLGKNRRVFEILKFRTMVPEADRVLHEYLAQNPDRQAEWNAYQKLKNDPRITPVGRFLRRFSLDELPQLWNVLKGEMSIVGPRPIMINQQDLYGPSIQHYVRVRPGITGIWQTSGRNLTSFLARTEYDVEYVMNWSIWLDIYILARTFWVVIRHDGVS